MTAKEVMTPFRRADNFSGGTTVEADMPVIEILPRLLESPSHELGVCDGGVPMGVIDRDSLLEGLGRMISPRDDCSVITVECTPEEYSASRLAMAVEDSDAHLVDLLSAPGTDGKLNVTLRVRQRDPSAAVRSLERYDYKVVEAHGSDEGASDALVTERLLSLRTLLNV